MASDAKNPPGSTARVGRPPKLSEVQVQELLELVRERPLLSLDDVVDAFRRETRVTIAAVTVRKYLREAGFERARPPRAACGGGAEAASATSLADSGSEQAPARRDRYHAAHRDAGDAVSYPCGLTDVEWAAVEHIFDPPGRTGRPPKYPRRQMLDACIYVLRSGCAAMSAATRIRPQRSPTRSRSRPRLSAAPRGLMRPSRPGAASVTWQPTPLACCSP